MTEQDKQNALVLWLIAAGGILAIYWVPWAITKLRVSIGEWGIDAVVVGAARRACCWSSSASPPRQLVAALLVFCALVWLPSGVKRGEAQRSYFGVYRVQTSDDGDYHTLIHGTTLHGAQRVRDDEGKPVDDTDARHLLLPDSPMAQTIAKVRERLGEQKGPLRRHRPRRRLARLPLQGGRGLALLRDRSGDHRHRQQPATTSPSSATASPSPTSCSAMRG